MRAAARSPRVSLAAIGGAHSVLRRSRKTVNCACAAREYAATALFDGD
jgi:hypothetical protein